MKRQIISTSAFLVLLLLLLGGNFAAGERRRRLLGHWNGVLPPPAPRGINTEYNPAITTADAARTWNPVYPTPYYIEKASIMFEPACPMIEVLKDVSFKPVHSCLRSQRHDVAAELTIEYAIVQGPKSEGYKSIGDAPSEDSPSPIVTGVTDGDGVALAYKVYRQDTEWWLHYTFAKPTAKRQYYTVKISLQLRKVLTGSIDLGNTFKAYWMQEWNAPVKSMHLLFSFPSGYYLDHFEVRPGTSLKGDDEPSQITSVCCGVRSTPRMERCTNDDKLGKKWAAGRGACTNMTIQLATTLAVSKKEGGAPDEGLALKDVYSVEFSPGIVDDLDGAAVNHKTFAWIFILIGILLLPAFAALVYFTYTVGRTSAEDFDSDMYQKGA